MPAVFVGFEVVGVGVHDGVGAVRDVAASGEGAQDSFFTFTQRVAGGVHGEGFVGDGVGEYA